jgi:hypothetical protein
LERKIGQNGELIKSYERFARGYRIIIIISEIENLIFIAIFFKIFERDLGITSSDLKSEKASLKSIKLNYIITISHKRSQIRCYITYFPKRGFEQSK